MLSQFELQYDDCKDAEWPSSWIGVGNLPVASQWRKDWQYCQSLDHSRGGLSLLSGVKVITSVFVPGLPQILALYQIPQPNHAVFLPLALQLWVPNGHFHCVEVKTEWSMFHLLLYREKMICTCRSSLSIIVNNISSGHFRQPMFVIFSPHITKAD